MDNLSDIARAHPAVIVTPHSTQTTHPVAQSFRTTPIPIQLSSGGALRVSSHTLLSALAPHTVAPGLRAAFGDVERNKLLSGVKEDTLASEYIKLGLDRKKRFTVDDLRNLIAAPHVERDAWRTVASALRKSAAAREAAVLAVAPLLAFVGRRLDAEIDLASAASATSLNKFVDVVKKRPGRVTVVVHEEDGSLDIEIFRSTSS